MKRFLIALFIALLLPCICFAEGEQEYYDGLSNWDLSVFQNELDDETYRLLQELGLDTFDYSAISSLSFESLAELLRDIAQGRIASPVNGMLSVIAFILLSALFQSLTPEAEADLNGVYSTCSALVISIVIASQISGAITLCATSIKLAGSFIFAFVPVFCAIVAASGGISTGFSANTLLLLLSQGLSFISANVFMPLINCFLAIGICSSLRAELKLANIIGALKRGITTAVSVLSAAFVSILSIKTSIASRADMLGLRSVRFVINSVVPVIGGAVSEGLLSIHGYSSLIKSSVGTVAIAAIALLFLPPIIEITLWRVVLSLCSLISETAAFQPCSARLRKRRF